MIFLYLNYINCFLCANRVLNDRNRWQTEGYGSLLSLLRRTRKFPTGPKFSFCKGGTTWTLWSPLCYWAQFSSMVISRKPSAKQWEPVAKRRIWKALAFADKNSEVSNGTNLLVLQRGSTWRRGPPFAIGHNFQVWISRANRELNDRNRWQREGFGRLSPSLTRTGKFPTCAKWSFCKRGTAWPLWCPLC